MSSAGATQQWNILATCDESGNAAIKVTYGQLNGKQQETSTFVYKGKNIGRTNETTPYGQAVLEASGKWKKQKYKGYSESAVVAKPEHKPMLAHSYDKYKHKVSWDTAWAQPKLDGIRCLARWENGDVRLYSRGGKPILTMKHIVNQLKDIAKYVDLENHPTLDGELYVHGEKFQNIVSWVKKEQPDSLKIEYHIYDVITPETFTDRTEIYLPNESQLWPNIKEVPLVPVYSEEDLQDFHDSFVMSSYEGAMLRWGDCLYKEGYRSQQLLKFKKFDDSEFEIVGASEGKGRFEGMCVFQLKTEAGGLFDCMPEGSAEERRAYWDEREKYMGKMMTVRFFGWSTSAVPLPRFPIGVAVRSEYE